MNNQQTPTDNKILKIANLAHKAGLENNSLHRVIRLLQINEQNFNTPAVQGFMKECSDKILKNTINGITPAPFRHTPEQIFLRPIKLGRITTDLLSGTLGSIVGIFPIPALQCITLITGSEGTGKTNLGIYVIPSQILIFNETYGLKGDDRIGCWFVRTSKKSDENYLSNLTEDLLVFDHKNFKCNPLFHQGHDKNKILNDFVRMMAEITYFREGTANNLIKILENLDKRFNGEPYTLFEVFEEAKILKTKYEEILPNRLQGMLSFNNKEIFNCVRGITLEKIAHDFVLFDFSNLDFYAQQFLAIYIFKYVVEHYRNQEKNKLNTKIIFDEGDNVFGRHSGQVMMGYPTISDLITTSRASGVGALVISHHPNLLIQSLRSEAYTKIIFNLSAAEDAHYMASACSLSKDEEIIIPKLPNHYAILSSRDFPNPLLIKPFNLADILRKKPAQISEKSLQKIELLEKEVITRNPQQQATKKANDNSNLYFEPEAKKLLENIYNHPFIPVVGRYKILGFPNAKGDKALKYLAEKDLLRKVLVKTSAGRGGVSTFLEITNKGSEILGKKKAYEGHGKLKHSYYCYRIKKHFENQGFEVKQEYEHCDIAVKNIFGIVGYEVCLETNNIMDNISRNERNGFSKTVLVFENKKVLEKQKKILEKEKNIECALIEEFL